MHSWLRVSRWAADYPAPTEGDYTIRDFKFASGETLPELRLHYRTLGKPEKDAQGKTTNAVLIMHGTTGSGAQFIRPEFAGELFGKGSAARCDEIFHRVTGRDWSRQIEQAERRHAREIPALRLRRHGGGAVPSLNGGTRRGSRATRSWERQWAECTPGSGASCIPISWTR